MPVCGNYKDCPHNEKGNPTIIPLYDAKCVGKILRCKHLKQPLKLYQLKFVRGIEKPTLFLIRSKQVNIDDWIDSDRLRDKNDVMRKYSLSALEYNAIVEALKGMYNNLSGG